jgi:hypothetical protein
LERAIIAPGFSGFQFRLRGAGLQQLYLGFYFPEQLKACFVPTALFSCRWSFSLHPIPQKIPEQMDSAGKKV